MYCIYKIKLQKLFEQKNLNKHQNICFTSINSKLKLTLVALYNEMESVSLSFNFRK